MPENDPQCLETEAAAAGTLARVACGLLGLVAVAALVRAVWMGVTQSQDLEIVLTAARAWRLGLDPYDAEAFLTAWTQTPGMHPRAWAPESGLGLYPASTYMLLSPLTILPLGAAKAVWAALNVGAYGLLVAGLRLLGAGGRGCWEIWVLAAVLLLLYPIQTHFRLGQTALIPTALMVWALGLLLRTACRVPGEKRGIRIWSIAVLAAGVALAIKPQVALPLLGFAVLRGRWRPALGAVFVAGVAVMVGAGWMIWNGHAPFAGLAQNVRLMAGSGILRADLEAPFRHQLLNLHVLLYSITNDAMVVRYVAQGAVLVLAVVASVGVVRRRGEPEVLAGLAAIGCLALMITYHRPYDAVMLAPGVAWWLAVLRDGRWSRSVAWWVVTAGLLVFTTPGGAFLVVLAREGWIPIRWTQAGWWQYGALVCQAWAVLLLAVTFTWVVIWGTAGGDGVVAKADGRGARFTGGG